MARTFKNPFKNSKLKAFVVFLFLASVFWMLTKFSKQDVGSVVTTINYVNIPQGFMLNENTPEDFSFNVNATRFEFLGYVFKKPNIKIDVGAYFNESTNTATVDGAALEKLILKQVVDAGFVTQLSLPEVILNLEQLSSKKVPVVSQVSISYNIGFDGLGARQINPDSITITGSRQMLDTIFSVKTTPLELLDISASFAQDILLQSWPSAAVTISPKKVTISQKVSEFSQKILMVPVTMINQPPQGNFKLLPASIRVAFNVPVAQFNEIVPADFTIICDYNTRDVEDNFVIPLVTQMPANITGVEMETKKIDLLIFK
ncbi:YbbR-like domain-containing protein [Flavobacteriaceae bacterium]|nr:YbbR-like domain-containing protein [Flavobacteriaceae bacterium]